MAGGRARVLPPGTAAAAVAFAAVLALGAQNGGFFADAWAWVSVPLLLLVAGLLFSGRAVSLTRLQAGWLGAFALLTAWTALSALWAPTAGPPVTEATRALLYVAAIAATIVVADRREPGAPAAGVLGAAFVLCVWALAGKALGHAPSRLEGPIGYTNGLGLVAATGALLAVGLAPRRPWLLAALAVFLPTLALTSSRGSWLALGAGLVVLVLWRRPRLLVALALAAVLALLAAHRTSHGGHLSSLSSNGRGDYWRVAVDEVRAHPLLGGGGGTWSRWWLAHRPDANGALDAHELYLETLAELGPVGLALLLSALALPLVAARRLLAADWARACLAAYVALLVHAALDWDWELPGVALCGLLCGTALLTPGPARRLRARPAAVAAAVVAAAAAFALDVGNTALRNAEIALDAGRLGQAAADARRAERWQPWATEPRLTLGEAQLAAGDVDAAARTLRSVVRSDPGDADAWYQLALATGSPQARARARVLDPHGP